MHERTFVAARRCSVVAFFFIPMVVACRTAMAADTNPAPAPPPAPAISATTRAMRYDAALHAVCFVDAANGWAVGDRGVIWHTDDGGTTWHEQSSNVTCTLVDVWFLNARCGWAVGGECTANLAASRGLVLRTDDGGATWQSVQRVFLPRLAGVRFFDAMHGIAFGDAASYAPAGAFATRDGGATWQPLASDTVGVWLAGDFLDAGSGALAGPVGQLATCARHALTTSPLATQSLRSIRAMRLIAPTGGWAVGDGGLLLTTHDLGRSWQTPPTDLPPAIAHYFDFRAVAVQGTHIWAAGSPGTRVLHSPDEGQSWQVLDTGQTAPIRALTFIDAEHGWAVGDGGNILATADGGQTWHAQRVGGQRAALVALFAEPTDVPLELLAESGAAEGYCAAVEVLCTPRDAPQTTPNLPQRTREALLLAGAASAETAWRLPLPPADLAMAPADLITAFNRENDGRALDELQLELVRELRIRRPDVVVTHHNAADAAHPLAALVEQQVAQAVLAAADPEKYPELASAAGLPPWQVKKVYGLLPAGARGDELLTTGRFSPWLGTSLGDFAFPARRLLAGGAPAADTYELKLLFSNIEADANARGLFAGIALAPGCEARRPQTDLPTQDMQSLRALATRRRHLQELMQRNQGSAAWAAQVSKMIDGLSADDAGTLLLQLADGYRQSGRLDLAADTYFLLTRRFPDHPAAENALDWLVKFYASSELAHRLREPAAFAKGQGDPVEDATGPVQQASAKISTAPTPSRDDRLRRATQLADYLRTARPAIYADPSVRFAETTAQRELGFANPAQRFFLTLRQLPESDAWRQTAATEEWLAYPGDMPPTKKLANCRPTDAAPELDAKLDEPFWSNAERLMLGDGTVGRTILSVPHKSKKDDASVTDQTDRIVRPAHPTVQLAYDQQCLYLAVMCPKSPGCDYTSDDTPRPRDADLAAHDRVTIRIDTDRDYTTAYELTVDHRGFTHDACWGDASWNPNWYVAAGQDESTWTIEAAIPLAELVDNPPAARSVWALSLRRTIPRVGYETWCGPPTSGDTPAHAGLLIFQ